MLRLLALRGTDAVGMLRGMFAFALWDDHARQLMLARDPLGIKPLYICVNPDPDGEWSLMFSSEVRSILAAGLLEHPDSITGPSASMLWNGFVVGPMTAVAGVELLGAGEWRTVEASGTVRRTTYWSIPRREDGPPIDEAELRHVVEDSVARHLIADVPVGIFLSGGIDSSAVAALAQRAQATPVHTFTLSFDEQDFDEGAAAAAIAAAIGTEHHEIRLREADFTAALDTADRDARSTDIRRSELLLHLEGRSRSRSHRGAGRAPAATSCSAGIRASAWLQTLQTWNRRTVMIPAPLRAIGRPVREPHARRLQPHDRSPRRGGPSFRKWFGRART